MGRGAALFAEDQRVLGAFAAAAQTAYEGRRLSEKAREAGELATVDRQRTALLAAVGHDLRTPLAGIKASVGTLRQTDIDWSREERDQLLATIEDSADRLDSIVANLLDAGRLQAGALSVRTEAVALDEVIGAAVLAVPGALGRVTVDVPENLPLVQADPGLLEPFQRVGNGGTYGVGLGLTVARGFMEAMDGVLIADGSSGGGLTMRLRLPLAK
jgi:two-component system sensor histidine kinase KdpD